MLKRTTVYLDPSIHKALKLKAIHSAKSISDIIMESLRLTMKEDAIDLQSIQDRMHEPSASYEAVLKDLKKDGLL